MNKTETIQTIDNILTDEADYVVFAGEDRNTSRPEVASFTLDGACAQADKLAREYKYVQVAYMPQDDDDISETVLEIINGKVVIGGAK
jgi:hypothetical protein